jgi:hypothetical protein
VGTGVQSRYESRRESGVQSRRIGVSHDVSHGASRPWLREHAGAEHAGMEHGDGGRGMEHGEGAAARAARDTAFNVRIRWRRAGHCVDTRIEYVGGRRSGRGGREPRAAARRVIQHKQSCSESVSV